MSSRIVRSEVSPSRATVKVKTVSRSFCISHNLEYYGVACPKCYEPPVEAAAPAQPTATIKRKCISADYLTCVCLEGDGCVYDKREELCSSNSADGVKSFSTATNIGSAETARSESIESTELAQPTTTPVTADAPIMDAESKAENGRLRWIPVSERLPNKDGEYLITGEFPTKVMACEYSVRYAGWRGMGSGRAVTHWMPLPEPPAALAPAVVRKGEI